MSDKNLPQRWINTPFAYTRFSHSLTLLQQDVLIRVSDHLQHYIERYYGSDLKNSRDVPRPLFSDADKNSSSDEVDEYQKHGMMEIMIDFAELGITPNNYGSLRNSIAEVLSIKVEHEDHDEQGRPVIKTTNIFWQSEAMKEEASVSPRVRFRLTKEVVDHVFDMSQGYVSHPEDIARISSSERMPMMYYLLKHESHNWRDKMLRLTPMQIKKYLRLIEEDPLTKAIVKESYPKYSKFRDRILEPSIRNINDLHASGQIDVSVTWEAVYPGTRSTGNPQYLLFKIDTSKPTTARPVKGQILMPSIPFADAEEVTQTDIAPRRRGRPKKTAAAQPSVIEVPVENTDIYCQSILDSIQFELGNTKYADLFGTHARCTIGEGRSVTLYVPSSRVNIINEGVNDKVRIAKAVAKVIGEGASIKVESL